MPLVGVCVRVSGRVQGVWFRKSSQRRAIALELTGSAVNLADGRVELFLYGETDRVDEMLNWLAHGPPTARVDELVHVIVPYEQKTSFDIG